MRQGLTVMIELAFYIDKKGWRVRKNFMIHWESNPQTFAYKFPYVIAFDPALIEIRHMDTVSTSIVHAAALSARY